jgi:hypothetical protein
MLRRRGILLGCVGVGALGALATAGLLAERGVLPGKGIVDEQLGLCDASVPPIPTRALAGPEVNGSFDSARRGRLRPGVLAVICGGEAGERWRVHLWDRMAGVR